MLELKRPSFSLSKEENVVKWKEGVEVNLPTVYSWRELFVVIGWSPNVRQSRSDGTSDSFLIGNRMPGVYFVNRY